LAVSVRAEPRLTRDVDLAVTVRDDADAEGLVRALQARGYRVLVALEQEQVERLAGVRLALPSDDGWGIVVDLLFASSGIEDRSVEQAEDLEVLEGIRAPVARLGHLLAIKVLARDDARRPQDLIDIRGLVAQADDAECARARAGVLLIARRRFDRGRD